MRKKRKPHEERKSEDYHKAADDSLELAKVLAGRGGISDQDFLERMARSDDLVDHDGETCGLCHHMILGAQVAREMVEAGEHEDVVSEWAAETRRRWERSKYYQLWQEEQKAGRDPHQALPRPATGQWLLQHSHAADSIAPKSRADAVVGASSVSLWSWGYRYRIETTK